MKKKNNMKFAIPVFLAILFVIFVYVFGKEPSAANPLPEGFCGSSQLSPCSLDSDCMAGGCSGQVCQSRSSEPVLTTCEFNPCYRAGNFNLACKCMESKCQWASD